MIVAAIGAVLLLASASQGFLQGAMVGAFLILLGAVLDLCDLRRGR